MRSYDLMCDLQVEGYQWSRAQAPSIWPSHQLLTLRVQV